MREQHISTDVIGINTILKALLTPRCTLPPASPGSSRNTRPLPPPQRLFQGILEKPIDTLIFCGVVTFSPTVGDQSGKPPFTADTAHKKRRITTRILTMIPPVDMLLLCYGLPFHTMLESDGLTG